MFKDMKISHDMCSDRPLEEVMDDLTPATHGMSCAGVIGMVANNKKCGVGIAYEASIAGASQQLIVTLQIQALR